MSVLDNKKISFIGGGNMAQALISGLVSCGIKPSLITVADPSSEAREQLAAKGLNTVDPTVDATAAIIDADIVVLAVKPQVMKPVVSAFANVLDQQSRQVCRRIFCQACWVAIVTSCARCQIHLP